MQANYIQFLLKSKYVVATSNILALQSSNLRYYDKVNEVSVGSFIIFLCARPASCLQVTLHKVTALSFSEKQ